MALLGIANYSFAFGIVSKEAAIPIVSVPYTISSPGIYYLANNIFSHANAEITISASNVVLDLGGHTLQVSSTDVCIRIQGQAFGPETVWTGSGRGSFNVTIQNGTLVNNVAGCIYIGGGHGCVIDHVSAISVGQCTLMDLMGANNRISNCTFSSGFSATSWMGPVASHGPSEFTVFLDGCGDLFENNIISSSATIGGPLFSGIDGADGSNLGNVLRNNVIWSAIPNPRGVHTFGQFDVAVGNLFPESATQ